MDDVEKLTPEQIQQKIKEADDAQANRINGMMQDVMEVWKKHNPLKDESLFVLISMCSLELFNAPKDMEVRFYDRLKIAVKRRKTIAHQMSLKHKGTA